MHQEAIDLYGNQLRVRVCGIYIQDKKILLVKHHALQEEGFFWAPPGGGLQFGESLVHALQREFLEETGLEIEVKRLVTVTEYLRLPLHAVELFFEVQVQKGILKQGKDPEISEQNQIISGVEMLSLEEIERLKQQKSSRHVFHKVLEDN
ncbi:MAG: NUDIX domain-containing protein, partial [Bacteroidia bacterium]|nr:NUDIX domain-containing protein [Bacteroidia bacterium]